MYKTGYVLTHPVDYDNSMWFPLVVEVWRGEHMIDKGLILRHSEFCVRMAPDDRAHVKETNEFRIGELSELD